MHRLLCAIALLVSVVRPAVAHADTTTTGYVCAVTQHGPFQSYGSGGFVTVLFGNCGAHLGPPNDTLWICGAGATACNGALFGDAQQTQLVKTLLDAQANKQVVQISYTSAWGITAVGVSSNGIFAQ